MFQRNHIRIGNVIIKDLESLNSLRFTFLFRTLRGGKAGVQLSVAELGSYDGVGLVNDT